MTILAAPQRILAKDGIRPALPGDAEAIASINVACWREAYKGIIADDILANRSVEESAGRWREYLYRASGSMSVFVAQGNGRVLGFGSSGRQRDTHLAAIGYSGEITTLYVRPGHQGRGIGTRLMAALARNLVAAGHVSASVWVLERNVTGRRFYESLQGRLLPQRQELPRLGNVVEVPYAWPVLRALYAERPAAPIPS